VICVLPLSEIEKEIGIRKELDDVGRGEEIRKREIDFRTDLRSRSGGGAVLRSNA